MQLERVFFAYANCGKKSLPQPPTEDKIREYLSPQNSNCPLNEVIVSPHNEGNMQTLRRFAFAALKRVNRNCRGANFGIYSGSGQGKTYIVKQWAKTIGIPFVFVQSSSISDTWSLFEQIRTTFDNAEFLGDCFIARHKNTKFPPIVEHRDDANKTNFSIPPCIVFFDEAHLLPKKMMQGGLLNAMERDDGVMVARPPGVRSEAIRINVRNVCWVAATTERGRLFDAMENRLGAAIEWHPATITEIADIIRLRLSQYVAAGELPFMPPDEACLAIARYRKIPREAINFAQKVVQQKDMVPDDTWEATIKKVAQGSGIDDSGFSLKQLEILKALGQRPIAESRLGIVAKCRIEQVERFELPMLMAYDNGGPLVVAVSGKGIAITESGLKELEKHNIPHRGKRITAEHFESRR